MYTPNQNYTELCHHGILGMKWGVRRFQNADGSLTSAGKRRYNDNYTLKQRIRDRAVYGSSGEKRINQSMNEGYNVSGARSKEAARINATRSAATTAGQVGGTVGKIGGAVGGYLLSKTIRNALQYSSNETMRALSEAMQDPSVNMIVGGAITTGISAAASTLGRSGAQSMVMLMGGYAPNKYRYA